MEKNLKTRKIEKAEPRNLKGSCLTRYVADQIQELGLNSRRNQDGDNLRTCILVDASGSLNYRHLGPSTKFDYACTLAAGLIYLKFSQRDPVSFSFYREQIQHGLALVSSLQTLNQILLEMEKAESVGVSDIEKSLHQVAEMLTERNRVIILSDLLQPPDEIARGIQHLNNAQHTVEVFHILDGAEISFPFHGLMDIYDLESGVKLLIEADKIRSDYCRSIQKHLDQVRRLVLGCGASYSHMDTRTPMLEILAKRTKLY